MADGPSQRSGGGYTQPTGTEQHRRASLDSAFVDAADARASHACSDDIDKTLAWRRCAMTGCVPLVMMTRASAAQTPLESAPATVSMVFRAATFADFRPYGHCSGRIQTLIAKIFEARKRETAALGAGEKLVLGHPLAATIGDSARCMQNLEKVLFTGPKTSDTVTFICEQGKPMRDTGNILRPVRGDKNGELAA